MFFVFGRCSIIKTKTYIFKTVRLGSRVCENVHEDNCNCTTKPAYKFRPSYRLSELPELCWVLTIDTVSIVRGAGWISPHSALFFTGGSSAETGWSKPAGGGRAGLDFGALFCATTPVLHFAGGAKIALLSVNRLY